MTDAPEVAAGGAGPARRHGRDRGTRLDAAAPPAAWCPVAAPGLASVDRIWSGTDAQILPHGSLRIVDLVNLLVVVPASALGFYLLLEHLLPDVSRSARRALRVAFAAAL
jgi:hypothetical protein